MFEIERDATQPSFLVRIRDSLDNDDLTRIRRELMEATAEHPSPAILFDVRAVTEFDGLTAEFLRSLPSSEDWAQCHDGDQGPGAPLTASETLYGLARLYQLSCGDGGEERLKIFRDARSALEYVGFIDSPSPADG